MHHPSKKHKMDENKEVTRPIFVVFGGDGWQVIMLVGFCLLNKRR